MQYELYKKIRQVLSREEIEQFIFQYLLSDFKDQMFDIYEKKMSEED